MKNVRVLQIGVSRWDKIQLREVFHKNSLVLKTAHNLEDAFHRLGKRDQDLVWISDSSGEQGVLEVLKKIYKKHPGIPIILSTDQASVSEAVHAIQSGASDYVETSETPELIIQAIRTCMTKHRQKKRIHFSEDLMTMLVENVPDIIYSLNPQGEFISLSPAVEHSLGYKIQELLGQSVFKLIVPEDRDRILNSFQDSVRTGDEDVRTMQFRMRSKSGEIKDFEIRRKLYFEEGQVVRNDGIARDISERKNLERELRRYSEGLEERVKERTEKLEYVQKQLLALNEVSNRFAQKFNEDDLLEEVPKLLTESLDFDRAALILKDNGKWRLRSYCFGEDSPAFLENYLQLLNDRKITPPSYLKQCAIENKTVFIDHFDDQKEWPAELQKQFKIKSLVASPVRVQGKTIGIIEGDMTFHTRDMDQQDILRFRMFANMVGLALDNIRAYQDLENRVTERTHSLNETNKQLKTKAGELEKATLELANANVEMLAVQEQLEKKNTQMQSLIQQISQNEEVLQSILDSSASVILMVNQDGEIAVLNRITEKFFNIAPEKLIGSKFSEFIKKIKPLFEDSNKFSALLRELKHKPDRIEDGSMPMDEFYRRALRLKSPNNLYLSVFSMRVKDHRGEEIGQLWTFFDISQMKLADEKLRAIVEASPVPFIISRQSDGKVLYANKPLADLIGLSPDKAMQSFTPDFYADSEDRHTILKMMKKQGFISGHEVKIRKADGKILWMIMSLVPSKIENEPVVIGALYDINERRMAEEALRKERNFVSAVLNTSGALVIVLDTKGNIVRFNRACEVLTGWKFEEVRGERFWDLFILPEETQNVRKTFNNLKAGQFPNTYENYWISRSGEKFLIAWSNTCMVDDEGNVEFIVGTGIDITERKKAEERLRLYREIFLNSNDGIAIFSPAGYLKERNPAHKKYTGYGDSEAEGKNIIEFIGVQNAQKIRQSLEKTGNYRGEISGHTKRGKSVELDLSIFSIYGEKKELNCYVGIARNITERKKAEIALREAHDQLEKRVAERTRELAELNIKLREEIEERKQTEAALLESEAQIRAFLEAIPDLIFRLNREGIYLDYQAPVGSDLAIAKEHVVGKNISETLPPELTKITLKSIRKALRTRQTEVLEYQLSHEGHLRDFEARIVVSGKDDVLAIVRDITDQKRAKEALQQARDQLEMRVKERTAELALLNESLLQEITERVQAEETLAKRLHYEEGLAACSEALLTHDDMHKAIDEALAALRDAVDISRVYIFENFTDEKDGLCMRQINEVCAQGVKPEINNPELQHFPYKEGFNRWKVNLKKGSAVSGLIKNFPEKEKAILETQGILSILIIPVSVAGKWFGFIGFDDVVNEREWDSGDIRLLQTASEMIGNYLGKKSAEMALKMSEERFRSLVENAHDIIYSMKPDGTFSYISPQFTKYTGHQVKEFLGKPLKLLIHPDDYTESERRLEFRIIGKDGSWRWFTLHSTPIRDEKGQILETIGIAHDVTEIKNAMESLEKANRDLRDTQLQLIQSEKMASLGMLVAGIAHEINTPVGAINSMHNTLMRATEKLNRELKENYTGIFQQDKKLGNIFYLIDDAHKVISSAGERVTNIVRRLRSFARLDEAELKEVDIHDGIEDTLTIVHHELKHHVTVKKEYGKLPRISCYPGRLNQVFLNLLINAKQAIRDKGNISVRTYHREKKIYIEIEDDGIGISKENIKKIFDPGYTTKGVGVGTGLGLSIVYQIIQDHRGDIDVKSEVGKGTVFTVVLPINLEEILNSDRLKESN